MRMWQGVSGISKYEGIVSPAYTVCEPRDSDDSEFLGYLCELPALVSRFHAYSQGIVSDTLNLRFHNFGEIVVSLPPPKEQRKIATTLTSVDDAITATRKVIEQTKRVKQGLLQTLMTRGIGHARFKKTEIGEIPEGWKIQRLKDLCKEKITYGIVQCGPHVDGGVPYIRVSDMTNPELDVGGMLRTSISIAAKYERSRVEVGDVVYALRGSIGEVRIVHEEVAGANLTQGTARLSPSSAASAKFLLWVLRSPLMLRQAERRSKGSTFKEITLSDLRRLQVPVPTQEEQGEIVGLLDGLDASVRVEERFLGQLMTLKTGLMQDLLTGRVRVPLD